MSGNGSTAGASTSGLERATRLAGPAAVVVSALGIFVPVVLASWVWGSWFGWTTHALSDLGRGGRPMAPIFNYSLMLAGTLGAAFCWQVWRDGTNAWHRLGAVMMGLGLLNSALVGVFNLPQDPSNESAAALHGIVALTYFVLLTLALFAHGSGDAHAGKPGRGVRSIWYGVAHVAGWVLLGFVPFDGIALPEMVGVLGLWAWTAQVYLGLGR